MHSDLTQLQVVLLGGAGLIYLSGEDVKRVKEFVRQEGRLIVAANHYMVGTVADGSRTYAVPRTARD